MWQFEVSFVFGLAAAPLMWAAGKQYVLYIYLVVKRVIKVPKILVLFNPICIYVLSEIIGIMVLTLTKDALLGQLFSGGAPFGYGLMFLGCYISAKG